MFKDIYKYIEVLEDTPTVSNQDLMLWKDVVLSFNMVGLIRQARKMGWDEGEFIRYISHNCVGKLSPDNTLEATKIIFNQQHIDSIIQEYPEFITKKDAKEKINQQSRIYSEKINTIDSKTMIAPRPNPVKVDYYAAITGEQDCNFPGCEELREKWQKDYEASGGENCTSCAHGKLRRKYYALLSKIIDSQN